MKIQLMNQVAVHLLAALPLIAGCAGELTSAQQEEFRGGSTGAGTATTGTATTGTGTATTGAGGGSNNNPGDILGIMDKACATKGCHGTEEPGVPGFLLNVASTADPSKYIGVAGKGDMACNGKGLLLINAAKPEESLIYSKTIGTPCGIKMPVVVPTNSGWNKTNSPPLILQWIKAIPQVASASGTGGAGGAGGGSTADGG
ncbi:MAG TPA: hypothetical protein VJT73_08590 [Polyangiaceae bacterium]|nr:hypothetical protein [Polyangiaceae bacterium]